MKHIGFLDKLLGHFAATAEPLTDRRPEPAGKRKILG
jgi:hypothetical protein